MDFDLDLDTAAADHDDGHRDVDFLSASVPEYDSGTSFVSSASFFDDFALSYMATSMLLPLPPLPPSPPPSSSSTTTATTNPRLLFARSTSESELGPVMLASACTTNSSISTPTSTTAAAMTYTSAPAPVPGRRRPGLATSRSAPIVPTIKNSAGKFACQECTRTYLHAKHLKRHMLRHTGDKPYKCSLCADSFCRSDILKRHVESCQNKRKNAAAAAAATAAAATSVGANTRKNKKDEIKAEPVAIINTYNNNNNNDD
ncbi:hypothetical protein V1514DRAFT_334347, partial [Lipomyces japonicus]|uniref:uncharacterized protein n=1 Tax=Lipomyces japonicus TaxID=56871 RepID=UPI0034CF67DA